MKLLIIGIVFILGLYFVCAYPTYESFSRINRMPYRCPNILYQSGSKIFLFNSKLANVPGVNPIQFNNLEDYVEFTKWQRREGIKCPILYLQKSEDIQGKPVYNAMLNPTNSKGGLPAYPLGPGHSQSNVMSVPTINSELLNNDMRDIAKDIEIPIDNMFQSGTGVSPFATEANWGGAAYTQKLVDAGVFKGDEVKIKYKA